MYSFLLPFLLLGDTLAKPLPQDHSDVAISLSTEIPLSTGGVSTTDTAIGWNSTTRSDTLSSTSEDVIFPSVTSSSSAVSTTDSTASEAVTLSATSDAAASPSNLPPGSPTSDIIAPSTTLGPVSGSSTVLQDPVTTSSDATPNFTSTVTTEPPNFSTETITGITSNTVLHTTGTDGQPTDVAVIHDDDHNDVGIILWGIPLLGGILFDLPLAIIPNVYFPCPGCIPITPPGTEGPDDPDDPDDPTSDSPNSSKPATSDTPSSTASQESSSTSSSLSSSSSSFVCTSRWGDPYNTKTVESFGPPDPASFSSMSAPASATSDQPASSTDNSVPSTSTDSHTSMTSAPDSTVISTATPINTPAPTSGFASGSVIFGPTTLCIGLGPGGAEDCQPISAGCWATSPSINVVPSTTCSGQTISTDTVV